MIGEGVFNKPAKERNISYTFTLAYALVSIIPLLILTYVVTTFIFPQVESKTQVTVLVGLGLTVACLGFFLPIGVIRSVHQMAKVASMIADGNVSERMNVEGATKELNELARSLNKIGAQLEQNVQGLQIPKAEPEDTENWGT